MKGDLSTKDIGSFVFKSFDHRWLIESRIGWMFSFSDKEKFGVTPYLGLSHVGESFDYGHITGENKDVDGGSEEVSAWRIPIGVMVDWNVFPEWSLGCNLQLNWDFHQRNKILDLKWLSADALSTKNEHNFNWIVEFPVTYYLAKAWDVTVTPAYYYMKNVNKNDGSDRAGDRALSIRCEFGYSF